MKRSFALLLLGACASAAERPLEPAEDPLASPAEPTAAAPLTGVVIALDAADIVAEHEGRVRDIHVELGARVLAGERLVTVTDARGAHALAVRRAAIEVAESELATREVDVADAADLLSVRERLVAHVPERELHEARFELRAREHRRDVAAASVRERRAAARELDAELRSLRVDAPFAGAVTRIYTSRGARVVANERLVRVAGTDLALRFAFPGAMLDRISPGVAISVGHAGAAYPAVVERVSPEADAASGLFVGEASFVRPSDLRAGMDVEVRLEEGAQ